MGFPVLSAALGEDKLIYGVVYVGVFNLINWSIGIILFDRKAMSWKRLLCVPCLSASIVRPDPLRCQHPPASVLTNALDMLGNTTTPLAMMIVGARLTKLKLADLSDVKLLLACAPAPADLPAGRLRRVASAGRFRMGAKHADALHGHALRRRPGHSGRDLRRRRPHGLPRRSGQHPAFRRHHTADAHHPLTLAPLSAHRRRARMPKAGAS